MTCFPTKNRDGLGFDQSPFFGYGVRLQMVFSRIMVIRPAVLTLLLAAGFCAISARAQSSEGAAPASAPAKADASAPSAGTGNGTLREIREELLGPLAPYSPKATMDRLMSAPPERPASFQPRPEDERTRALRRNKSEWVFTDLNELNTPPTLESLAGLPNYGSDGRDKNKLTPMERYFEDLETKRGVGSNFANGFVNTLPGQLGFSGSNSMNSLMFFSPGMDGLMGALAGGSNSAAADNHAAGGAFADSAPPVDKAALLDQKQRLEDFKHLLSSDSPGFAPSSPAPAGTSSRFSDLLNFGAPPVVPAAAPPVNPGNLSPALGSMNPPSPGYHSSLNVTPPTAFAVPGSTRLTTLPPPAPPPSKPVSLDPFKDNAPKRSF